MKTLKIIGWILVPYVIVFTQWKKLKTKGKTIGILWACFVFVSTLNGIFSNNATNTTTVKTVSNVSAIAKIDDKKDGDINEVQKFIKIIEDKKNESNPVFDKAAASLDSTDKFKIYDAMKNANDKGDSIRQFYSQYSVSSGTSSEVKSLLNKARASLETAYSTKSDAYKSAMKFVDDGMKPSQLDDVKQKLTVANSFFSDADKNVTELKQKLGIN